MDSSTIKKYTTRTFLGAGGYGTVYKCDDSNGKQFAIKFIQMGEEGITSLLEASIMMTYQHDYLNRAIAVESNWDVTTIIQEIAVVDLKVKVKNSPVDEPTAIRWIYSIGQAILFLHLERIIHCDIKTDNILLFEDGNVKLADFTLSVLKSHPEDTYSHSVCTLPYRAPEVFLGTGWSNPIDIWSFGCVIYEILTGEVLVPTQQKIVPLKTDKIAKARARTLTFQSLVLWRRHYESISLEVPETSGSCINVKLSTLFQTIHSNLQNLILIMTSFDPMTRPTIQKIVQNPIFDGQRQPTCHLSCKRASNVSDATKKMIKNRVNQIHQHCSCDYENISHRAIDLFSTIEMIDLERIQIIDTCIWIAYKLVAGSIPKILSMPPPTLGFTPLHVIYKAELAICQHLNYKLHRCADNDLYIKIGF
ncbi:Protein kinase [uncultured virus]|nr:Protein kinase [uncultured virus]